MGNRSVNLFSLYTLECLKFGGVIAILAYLIAPGYIHYSILYALTGDVYFSTCHGWFFCLFGLLFLPLSIDTFSLVFLLTAVLCTIGLVTAWVLYLSVQLDYLEEADKAPTLMPFRYVFWFFVSIVVTALMFGMLQEASDSNGLLMLLIGVFVLYFIFVGGLVLLPLVIATSIAAVFCFRRAIVFATTTTPVRRPYESGIATGQFSGRHVAASLGQPVRSEPQVRALRKDVRKLQTDVERELRVKQEEHARLTAALAHDVELKEEEAELSKKMRLVDELNAKNEQLRRRLGRKQ